MLDNKQQMARELSPSILYSFILVGGLITIAYAVCTQNILIASAIILLPITFAIILYGLKYPSLCYLLYVIYSYYITYLMRYLQRDGLSVGLDILLVFIFISILFTHFSTKGHITSQYQIKRGINILTLSYLIWIVFTLFQFINSKTESEGIVLGIRIWIFHTLILYIVSSIILSTSKILKLGLIIWGILTVSAFLKLLYQRYIGFDTYENIWLYNGGGASSHIIWSGIRYFSIFTDAGNYGANMGIVTIVFAIIAFFTNKKYLKLFYICVAIMGLVGMFMSGTRSAIIVPLGGLLLYCLLCKNIKVMLISAIAGLCIFVFLAFTDIGSGNAFIFRMRTAFRPTEDASFNVRLQNRKEIATYMEKHPWGAGIDGSIPRLIPQGETYREGSLPPDSFFVRIWIQTGYVGLFLYIAITIIVFLRCCYIVMFMIKDKQLHQILASLVCGLFGIYLNGYAGEGMGLYPTNTLIIVMIAFVLNGPYIDKEIAQQKIKSI